MTIEQKIPQSVPVATGQVSNGVTTINNRDNRIESAAFGFVSKALTGTSGSLTSAEFWEGSYFLLTGTPSGAFTLSVPAEERGPFTVFNDTGQPVTVQIAGQSLTAPIAAAGTTAQLVSDGVNVRRAAVSGSGIANIAAMSQAAYDALVTPDAQTLHVII
ncbi:hypothetical protein EET67_09915 [Pseudaminobacter arsenicus]|uniref:Minor tail protein gp31 C-terminal domain-containing protein n=1 Tax=Borborobacter arsenicus TaxID=1851146 RepID=A0A432V6Y1_9HYPH|nr:hypothetical protein [Pseudaminobacter arsenicus]RUM97921.1 hypothetical protein EET67_09915 [Pseudaminobacter arsenicus]